MKLYGIKNCDTVKKARSWLDSHNIDYHFHDLRVDGLDITMVESWLTTVDSSQLLNRRSTTWKGLDSDTKESLQEEQIPELLVTHPTLVKRPVLESDDNVLVGFNDKTYNTFFGL